MDMYTLLYLKWITNKDLLYSTGKPLAFLYTKNEKTEREIKGKKSIH